ncbi:MAG: ABC transporter substrate-binding protein [Tissierellia bacterium]|nr:ABC transporter substrate-binding protein [Tissierellia bacterium]
MKKISSLFAFVIMAVFSLVACSNNQSNNPSIDSNSIHESNVVVENDTSDKDFGGRTLNVVATSDSYVPLFDKFTEKTGAKVEFLSMSSGEVLSRMKAEGKPSADLWFGGGLDAFMQAKEDGLLEQYQSKMTEKVDEKYKDKDGYYISKGLTVVGFLVNTELISEKNLNMPDTWKDLADPVFEHEIIMSNPQISGTNYAALKGILDLYGEEEGWKLFEDINKNIDFYSKRGKDPQEKVAAGEFAIGIIPADKKAADVAKENNLTVVYPEDGIPWVPEGVACFKGSENVDIAKAFIDFMLTKEAQEMIAEIDGKDSAQIIVDGVKGYQLGLDSDRLIDQDLSTFGSDRDKVLEKFENIAQGKADQ